MHKTKWRRVSKNGWVREGVHGTFQKTAMQTQRCLLWSAHEELLGKILTACWGERCYVMMHLLRCWRLLLRKHCAQGACGRSARDHEALGRRLGAEAAGLWISPSTGMSEWAAQGSAVEELMHNTEECCKRWARPQRNEARAKGRLSGWENHLQEWESI